MNQSILAVTFLLFEFFIGIFTNGDKTQFQHLSILSDTVEDRNVHLLQNKTLTSDVENYSLANNYNKVSQSVDSVLMAIKFIGKSRVKLKITWFLREYNDITVYGFYTDNFNHRTIFYNHQLGIYSNAALVEKDSIQLVINLPHELFYYDHQNILQPTNYYASRLGIRVTLDLVNPDDNQLVAAIQGDLQYISFPDPWYRTKRPRYCISWETHVKDTLEKLAIPSCNLILDPNVFSTVLPLTGTFGGYTRKLPDLIWPSHILSHIRDEYESNHRFTVSMWFFLTKYCLDGCVLLQMRNTSHFHSPWIAVNSNGYLHVQNHAVDGTSEAFLSKDQIPLFTWVFVLLTVDTNKADVFIDFGNNSTSFLTFYGNIRYVFGGRNSLMISGGYHGTRSFHGYMGRVQLYRHFDLSHTTFVKSKYLPDTRRDLQNWKFRQHYRRCEVIRKTVYRCLGIVDNQGKCTQSTWWDRKEQQAPVAASVNKTRYILNSRLTRLVRNLAEELDLNKLLTLNDIAEKVHEFALKQLKVKKSTKLVVFPLLEVSGCLGHSPSLFVTATIYKYGIGIPIDIEQALRYHLLSANLNSPLSQLSLGYRHQLNLDGLPKDSAVRAGYVYQAAEVSKKILDDERHKVSTLTEMIRLDEADSFRNLRGRGSHLFKWLIHQTKLGKGDARNQMAYLLFNGRDGVEANQEEAIQHFIEGAEAGDPTAMYNLGVMYLKGVKGILKNITKAAEYFMQSIERKSPLAYGAMGFIEMDINKNRSAASFYLKKAAEMGEAQAMHNYAHFLHTGGDDGNTPDIPQAFRLYQEAAAKGERHSCMSLANFFIAGADVQRNEDEAIRYSEYLANQAQEIGLFMRAALNDYNAGKSYSCFLNYLFAAECGLPLPGYNIALLLEEAKSDIADMTEFSNENYFYNITAEMGWSLSLAKMGHIVWSKESNAELASKYFVRSIEKNNNPEGLFYLGYLVEHGYPLHKDVSYHFGGEVISHRDMPNNTTIASDLYRLCIKSTSENGDGYYPGYLAYLKLHAKLNVIHLQECIQRWSTYTSVRILATCFLATVILMAVMVTRMGKAPQEESDTETEEDEAEKNNNNINENNDVTSENKDPISENKVSSEVNDLFSEDNDMIARDSDVVAEGNDVIGKGNNPTGENL